MSHVYLLRHASAAQGVPGMTDFDRPLEQYGLGDARATGEWMAAAGISPDLVLCSPAKRTLETWTCIESLLEPAAHGVHFPRALYGGDAEIYLDEIRRAGPAERVLMIGHNPSITELTALLIGEEAMQAERRLRRGFPTSGLAAIGFDGPLSAIGAGKGTLDAFFRPER